MLSVSHNTIEADFEKLAINAELSFIEYASISRYQAKIEVELKQAFLSFTTILPGAFSRHTMTSPLENNVVDMLVLFNQTFKSKALPTVFVKKLEDFFTQKYDDCIIDEKIASILVPVGNFWFRVQPGFISDHDHYFVPSPWWNDWVEYNSLEYKQHFAKKNAEHQGKLLKVVRMMKKWNRLSGDIFDGYYLELLVKDVLDNYMIEHYSLTLNYIFKVTLAEVVFKKDDPANSHIQVVGLLDVKNLIMAMKAIKYAYVLSSQAIELENIGEIEAARSHWKELFPGYF